MEAQVVNATRILACLLAVTICFTEGTMRIHVVGSGAYAHIQLEYDTLRSTTVMMLKVQIMVGCWRGA